MTGLAIDALLALAALCAVIGALGFARLDAPLDRLHAAAFVSVATGLPIVIAAFLACGATPRAFKILGLWLVTLVAGAAVNQAVARAIFTRDEAGERM